MSTRRERPLLPAIDWRALWGAIRPRPAGGWCERCRRPHGQTVYHLDDGRWWDASVHAWRDGDGQVLRAWPPVADIATIAVTRVVLAMVHRDQDTVVPVDTGGLGDGDTRRLLRAWGAITGRPRKHLLGVALAMAQKIS